MKSFIQILTVVFFLILSGGYSFGQSAQYDIRIVKDTLSCDSLFLHVDIEIKAHNDTTLFNLADQNYRISFNRDAFRAYDNNLPEAQRSVQIVSELFITGFVSTPTTNSFYGPHNLTGSIDTIISYNLELSGGDGFPLSDTAWTSVGRISLQVIDITACADIWLHDHDPINFPSTFVSEKYMNTLFPSEEGDYIAYEECFEVPCPQNAPPMSNDDYINTLEGFPITYNILFNDIDTDNNLDPSTLTLLSTPDASEATVVLGPGSGEVTVSPTGIWAGTIAPFGYRVCDDFGECSTAQVFVTIDDDPTTNLTNLSTGSSVNVFPTLATQSLTVALNIQAGAQEKVNMEIVDMLGKTLFQQTERVQGKQSYQLNVDHLVAGSYFLKLQIGSETLTEKFIKQ